MQLARNVAVEWGPKNVRANCIAPGLVRTDFARALWEDPVRYRKTTRDNPLQRIGEPDEIAGAAVFLASPAGKLRHRSDDRDRWRHDGRRCAAKGRLN